MMQLTEGSIERVDIIALVNHFTQYLSISSITIDGTYQRRINRHAIKRNIFILDIRYHIRTSLMVFEHTPESLFRQRLASETTDYRIRPVTLFLCDPRSVGIPVIILESGIQLTCERH
jgi:hypothetical protein